MRRAATSLRLIKHHQFIGGDAKRPAVGDEMVHRQKHCVFRVVQTQQADAASGPRVRSKGRLASSVLDVGPRLRDVLA